MSFVIQRTDGTTDGLGDRVVFATEVLAWDAARAAFGKDPASDDGGVEAWLNVVEVDEPTDPNYGDLRDYETGAFIRYATLAEEKDSRIQAGLDGGPGVITVDGRRCYVQS